MHVHVHVPQTDFERILEADGSTSGKQLVQVLSRRRELAGATPTAIHRLAEVCSTRSFSKEQLCLAHPPEPSLGSSSSSPHHVIIITAGDAKLLCHIGGLDPETPTTAIAATHSPADSLTGASSSAGGAAGERAERMKYGPQAEGVPPRRSVVEKHLGTPIVTVATLGQGECVSGALFGELRGVRWCLQPTTTLEV